MSEIRRNKPVSGPSRKVPVPGAGVHWGGRAVPMRLRPAKRAESSIPGLDERESRTKSRRYGHENPVAVARCTFGNEGRLKVSRHRGFCGANL